MSLRDNIIIQSNAISASDLALLMDHVHHASLTNSLVARFEDETDVDDVKWIVDRNIRDTQEVQLPDEIRDKLVAIDAASVLAFINPFYNVEVGDREAPGILHYGVGGHYIPHVDAETLYKDDDGLDLWEKTLDRDLSVVYFLNDDYSGGELFFPEIDLVIKPEAGMLVCFPSDHHYVHGVRPVTHGHRYTIVNWMRVKNTPTMEEINQLAMDEYHRAWPEQMDQPPRLTKGGQ
jgi:predicted 2-oxoglutarate/Fe(II)-dependent dioxygenase YbiX